MIKEFMDTLIQMREVHKKKNADYATEKNPFSNFDVSVYLLSLFTNSRDQVFASIIGTKIGRLSSLLSEGKIPNNESIDDTFIDIANYVILWKCDRNNRKENKPRPTIAELEKILRTNDPQ